MRLTILVSCFCTLFVLHLTGQSGCDLKYDHIWILGGPDPEIPNGRHGGVELNFNSHPVSANPNFMPTMAPFQNCSFSLANGELLFYSNGCEVYGSDDEILDGGNMLNPGAEYNEYCPEYGYRGLQSMCVLPQSGNEQFYTIFHIDQRYSPDNHLPKIVHPEHVYATTVKWDDSLQTTELISKNIPILEDTSIFAYAMTAVRHANGQDWWIVIPTTWSMTYKVLLFTSTGTSLHSTQFLAPVDYPLAEGGQAKFSPDGRQYAIYYPKVIYNDRNILMLYQFDRETGLLSDPLDITIPFSDFITGGLEFSPSGQFLYYNTDTSLYQIDTWAEDIPASLTHIADYDGFGDPLPTRFFLQERTPDHRIIMNVTNGSKFLHVIQEPDRKGTACRFEQHAIELPTVNNFTLPHFPNYRLGALEDPPCDTMVGVKYSDSPDYEFSVYPNPVSQEFLLTIDFPCQRIQIFSAEGRELLTINGMAPGQVEIAIDHLPAGMYFVLIQYIDGSVSGKTIMKS